MSEWREEKDPQGRTIITVGTPRFGLYYLLMIVVSLVVGGMLLGVTKCVAQYRSGRATATSGELAPYRPDAGPSQ